MIKSILYKLYSLTHKSNKKISNIICKLKEYNK